MKRLIFLILFLFTISTNVFAQASIAGDVLGTPDVNDNAITRFDDTSGFVIQGSEAYINDNGNIGIGTSDPATEIQVIGDITATEFFGGGSNLTNVAGASINWDSVIDKISDGQINWDNVYQIGGDNINWDDNWTEEIQSSSINWDSVRQITQENINWDYSSLTDGYLQNFDSATNALEDAPISTDGTDIAITNGISTVDTIQFNTSFSDGSAEGRLQWSIDDGTIEIGMPGGNVNLQIGQETLIRVNAGEDISDGEVIYISGAQGNRPKAFLAKSDDIATSRTTIGVATEDISSSNNGYITVRGIVRGYDTRSFTAGDILYLSSTTAGLLTNIRPTPPNISVFIGIALNSTEEGSIYINPVIVQLMSLMSDVYVNSISDNEILSWDAVDERWENGLIQNDSINWDSVINELGDTQINWDSVQEIGAGNINWDDINQEVMASNINFDTFNQDIQSEYINWTSIVDEVADQQINWESVQQITNANINWNSGLYSDGAILNFDATGNTLEEGVIYTDGTNIGVGTISPDYKLDVVGEINASTDLSINDIGLSDTATGASGTTIIGVPEIGTSTYDNLQDYINNTMSSGYINGVTVTDNTDGTVAVSAGYGYIRADSDYISELLSFNWDAVNSLDLTDDALNYIYVNYNAGSPIISFTTDILTLDHTSEFVIALAYQESDHAHISMSGQQLTNFIHYLYYYSWEYDGIQRASGLVTSEDASEDRAINITAGVLYWALRRMTTSAFDSSTDGANQEFTYIYRNGLGGWTDVTGQHLINNANYDDGDGTLGTLTANRYGVHWVYTTIDGDIYIQYGQGNYTEAQALGALRPSTMPELVAVGNFIAKIIIQQGDTNFYNVFVEFDSGTGVEPVTDHGSLSGLLDDDHSQYSLLDGRSGGQSLNGGTAASDDLTFDSTANATKGFILLQPTSGNVGIGTSSPANVLDVDGGIDADTLNTGNGDYELFAMDQDVETTDAVTFATINTSGNVGIGTTTSSQELEVVGTVDADGLIISGSTEMTSVSTGTSDNDKLVTKGYVDDNAGGSSCSPGTPASKSVGTTYQSGTGGGWVEGNILGEGDPSYGTLSGFSDSNSTPTTYVGGASVYRQASGVTIYRNSFSFWVEPSDYYKITLGLNSGSLTTSMRFIPCE